MNARILYPQFKHAICLFILFLLIITCMARDSEHVKESREILGMIEGGTSSDKNIIERIGQRLDILAGATDPESVMEKVRLTRMASFIPYNVDKTAVKTSEDKRRSALEVYATTPFKPGIDGRKLMYFASGMMGIPVDQKEVIGYAKITSNPPALRLLALDTVLGQNHILPELEGDLAILANDDMQFIESGDVGTPTNEVTYPIRDKAIDALKKMRGVPRGKSNGKGEQDRPNRRPGQGESDPLARSKAVGPQEHGVLATETHQDPRLSIQLLAWCSLILAAGGILWIAFKRRN